MPTIPVEDLPQIQSRPRGANTINLDARGAFGSGVPEVAQAVGQVANEAAGMFAREKAKADDSMALEALNELESHAVDVKSGRDRGVLNLKGDQAVQASGPALDSITQKRDQLAGGLTNPDQRKLFLQRAASTLISSKQQVETHVAHQVSVGQEQTMQALQATKTNAIVTAYDDQPVRDLEIRNMEDLIRTKSANDGESSTVADARVEAWKAKTTGAVLNAYLAHQDGEKAAAYFAQVEDQLDPPHREDYQRQITATLTAQQSDRNASEFTNSHRNPVTKFVDDVAARAELEKMQPGKLKDETAQRLNHRLALAKSDEQETKVGWADEARTLYRQRNALGGGIGALMSALSPTQRQRLIDHAPREWQNLVDQAKSDGDYWRRLKEKAPHGETPDQVRANVAAMFDLAQHPEENSGLSAPAFMDRWGSKLAPKDLEARAAQAARLKSGKPGWDQKALIDQMQSAGVVPRAASGSVKPNDPGTWPDEAVAAYSGLSRQLDDLDKDWREHHNGQALPKSEASAYVAEKLAKGEIERPWWFDEKTTRLQAELKGKGAQFKPSGPGNASPAAPQPQPEPAADAAGPLRGGLTPPGVPGSFVSRVRASHPDASPEQIANAYRAFQKRGQ
jgi:hypothetical protein